MRDDRDDRREGDPSEDAPPRDPEELDERVAELEARVRDLRNELARPPEGPLGLPRPPTPREVLSFTGEYAIPTAIAVLEANVRALEALQQVVRVLDPERSAVREERDRLESRAADASRATLDRLESVLEDVETTIQEGDLPREAEARDVLEDARRINREIRDRVEDGRRATDEARERDTDEPREREADRERPREEDSADTDLDGGTTIELADESDADESDSTDEADESGDSGVEVDVEAELQSIKDEIEGPESEATDGNVDEDVTVDATDEADADDADETHVEGGDSEDVDAEGSHAKDADAENEDATANDSNDDDNADDADT